MSVIFLFIDGIGLGKEGEENPLLNPRWDAFQELTDGQGLYRNADPVLREELHFTAVDATLNMGGLPQSGTGQASLFSGENAAVLAGRHFGPYPHSKTRYLLEENSLFHRVKEAGLKPHFINAYPDVFFKKMGISSRWTCTTLMARSSGQRLNGLREVKQGKAVTAEIVQNAWREVLNLDIGKISPEEAAERVVSALDEYDLVLYEYYLTDKAGHSMDRGMSAMILKTLNLFIRHLLHIKSREDQLVICSDHGNLEDLSIKTHTRNPVPLIIRGRIPPKLGKACSIMDVPDRIMDLLIGNPQ